MFSVSTSWKLCHNTFSTHQMLTFKLFLIKKFIMLSIKVRKTLNTLHFINNNSWENFAQMKRIPVTQKEFNKQVFFYSFLQDWEEKTALLKVTCNTHMEKVINKSLLLFN